MEELTNDPIKALKECFDGVKDFRKSQGKQFELQELLAASVLAVLSGAEDFTGIAEYCKEKGEFLKRFFSFPRPPSHDLFRWIYAFIAPQEFYHVLLIGQR